MSLLSLLVFIVEFMHTICIYVSAFVLLNQRAAMTEGSGTLEQQLEATKV